MRELSRATLSGRPVASTVEARADACRSGELCCAVHKGMYGDIYGYANGVHLSRKIERATCDSVAFRYVVGPAKSGSRRDRSFRHRERRIRDRDR